MKESIDTFTETSFKKLAEIPETFWTFSATEFNYNQTLGGEIVKGKTSKMVSNKYRFHTTRLEKKFNCQILIMWLYLVPNLITAVQAIGNCGEQIFEILRAT